MSDWSLPKMPDIPTRMPDMSSHWEDMRKARKAENHRQEVNAGRYDAEGIFNHLTRRVREFEDGLDEDEEIGLQLANFGVAERIHVRSIAYKNPNLVEFTGLIDADKSVVLVQHISQLNFLLIAMKPVEEEPFRIGFKPT